jgi:hypothetical protein
MPSYRSLVFVFALSSVWAASPAFAQSSDTLGTVEVEGHYDNAIGSSDAASEGVVRGATIADRPVLRPGQVLETIPGMVVTQHSGDGKANQYFLRGFNLDHGTDFGTWVGALPVNMPTNAHGQGYTDLNFLIPELIDSIDYRKGPYFANEGDFSSAGSARINYKKSLDQNIADLTVGSYGYRRMLLAGSTELGAARDGSGPILLGALELAEGNGPWTNPENLRKVNALLRLSDGSMARGWSIDGAFYQAHWNSTDQVPLALIQSGQIGRFDALDPTDGGDTGRAYLTGEWHDRDASGYTRISTYLQHYRLQLSSNFTFFENNPELGDQFQQQESRNMLGGEAVRGWTHQLLGHDSITEAGFQVRHDDIDVSLRNTVARLPFETVSDDKVKLTETGLYLQNTTQWQPWFRSVFGLRQQFVDMSQTALVTPANSGSASDNKLLPKMSLIFGPWQKTEFFANYGQGFHSNDARGVIGRIDPTTGDAASPVPALVGSTGWEFGARTEIIPGLQSSLALWRLDSGSELVYTADAGTTEPNGASKRYGVEWNNHMIVNDWLLLDADLAWTHARYVEENANGDIGNYIPNAVSQVASIAATVRKGLWSGGLVTRYIGAYPLSQDGRLMAPSSTVTDLRVRRQITPKVALTFDLLNIFNRRYYDIAYEQDYRYPATAPIVPDGITVHPGEPRQLRVTLQVAL